MRVPLIGCLVLIVSLPALAPAQGSTRTYAGTLARADATFRQGVENKTRLLQARKHFSEATDAYLELHRRGGRSPALYLNLGNAATLADRWPEAIWAYHVGLKLDPNDRVLREHLAFVRAKVLYPAAGQGRLDADTWPLWLHRPTYDELTFVFTLSYALIWIAGTYAFMARSTHFWPLAIVAGIITIASGANLLHEMRHAEVDRDTPLVVIAENTPFYRGNAASYPQHTAVPVLPRGLEARQIHRRGNSLQIRLNTGEVGWLPRGQVLIVEP